MQESLENLFQRQEEMERNFNNYLQDVNLNHVQTRKRETSKSEGMKRKNKWLTP